jgi:hypothetical protein
VARRADPRRPDDVEPDVALVADRRLAGVQAHAHLTWRRPATRVPPVRAGRATAAATGVAGAPERVEECVPLRVDLAPVGRAEASRRIRAVVGDDRRVVVAQFVEQPGRASMSVNRNVTVPVG